MKKVFAIAALVLAAAVSCTKEIAPVEKISVDVIPEGYVPVTLSASFDPGTKAELDGAKLYWSAGESVAVFADGAGSPIKFTVADCFALGSSVGVKIVGAVPAGTKTFVAAYPYQEDMKCADGVVTMSIPAEQNIAADYTYDPAAFASVANFESAESTPTFYNVISYVNFTVGETQGVEEVRIYCAGDANCVGPVDVTVAADNAAPAVNNMCDGYVTLKAANGFAPGTVYTAVVAPLKSAGVSAVAIAGNKASFRSTENELAIERNKGKNLGDVTAEAKWNYIKIATAEELAAFLAGAPDCPKAWEAELLNDIDCSNVEIVPAETYNGVFDGQGYTLSNLKIANALIAKTGAGAVVKNINIAESCSIVWDAAIPDQTKIAFIVGETGTGAQVLNCNVAGSIKVTAAEAGRIICAGVVAQNYKGYVEGCKFTGSIDVELSGTSKGISSIGGVVSRTGHVDMADKLLVKDCVNEGSIKFLFSGATKKMSKFGLGGVVGLTPTLENAPSEHGIIQGCVNYGSVEWSYPEGGSGSYPAMGGVIGACEGKLLDCSNYGSIKYTGSKTVAVTDASMGGVAGYVTGNASNCHNYGTITLDAGFAGGTKMAQSGGNTSYSAFGGVFGAAGPYTDGDKDDLSSQRSTVSTTVTVENCTNNAALNLTPSMVASGGPKLCCGGVVGAATAHLVNCHNTKDISFTSNTKWFVCGGVAGFSTANITNCSNSGTLVFDGDKENHKVNVQQFYLGGIIGFFAAGGTISNCQNSGNVSLSNMFTKDSTLSYFGGIIGSYGGSISMEQTVNSGNVTSDVATPMCIGGVAGAFNGAMKDVKNSGEVKNLNEYCSQEDGKQTEVGGLIGYAWAKKIESCENTGNITNTPAGGFAGGLVGGHNSDKGAKSAWSDCIVNCSVAGGATVGAILGHFRYDSASADKYNHHAITVTDAEVYGAAAELPLVGNINGEHEFITVNLEVNGKRVVSFKEDLENKSFYYEGKKYPIVKLADGRWWMAAPLAYVPKGKTVSADPVEDAGIWYTYTTDGTTCTPNTEFNDGYLYDYPTAFGVAQDAITYGTRDEYKAGTNIGNFREFEGAQGICPPGWYIPTRPDFLKLVGASNKDDSLPENPETAAVEDNTAVYWDAAYKGSKIGIFNEAGWNFAFLGVRAKTSTAQTGAYNKTATKESTCAIPEWIPKPALNQVMCSTPYMPNVAGNSVQYFCMMSTFTAANNEGKLSLSYANYLHGVEVRCIKKVLQD